jgi:hypothetical protein
MQAWNMDIVDSARPFAAVGRSMADAVISGWYAKYKYGFWRPITAINLADSDGNPATAQDAGWRPLLVTPLGIHFRTADTAGVKMGQHVANWALGHYFRPLGD